MFKVLKWAKCACQSANLSPTPKNLRKKLGKAFSLIRFPAMNKEDFVNIVRKHFHLHLLQTF